MAGENIKTVKVVFTEKIGARIFSVAELTIPTKYLTEGMELSETVLKECGLTNGMVDAAWVVTASTAAKNIKQVPCQFNIEKPSASPESAGAQKVRVQLYESVTTEANKELASESEAYKTGIITAAFIGR